MKRTPQEPTAKGSSEQQGIQFVLWQRLSIVYTLGINGRSNGVDFTPAEALAEMRRRKALDLLPVRSNSEEDTQWRK